MVGYLLVVEVVVRSPTNSRARKNPKRQIMGTRIVGEVKNLSGS